MPMYEYECKACGNEFEELVFGEKNDIPCPKCGSNNTARKVSAACVRGSGATAGGMSGLGPMPSMGGGCGGGGFS